MRNMVSDIERAERNSRARATVMGLLAAVLVLNSTFGLDNPANDAATFRGGAWLFTIALGVIILSTNGGLMLNARLRALMYDERARANRGRALATGFFAAMLVTCAIYVISWYTPIELRAGLRLVMGLALAAGLARFALLEWF